MQYFYPGTFTLDYPSASLGGADPDFHDALVNVWVRGTDWANQIWWVDPTIDAPFFKGDELVFWAQVDTSATGDATQMSNWAHTGYYLTDALYSGDWTQVEYTLASDTTTWSYAGQSRIQDRDLYVYHPLHDVLGHLDVDFFHLLLFIDDYIEITGRIAFDELTIAYRNHSVLAGSNGGTLIESPAGSPDDAAAVSDGYRFGVGQQWQSAPDPAVPLTFVFELADPVTVEKVQIHNHPEWPSRAVTIEVSRDGSGGSASERITHKIEELGDWRGETLGRVRALIKEADPDILEEWKWMGTPVWSHDGIVCTGETYKSVVKMTFAKGASVSDPSGLFNSSLDGNVRRAIDIREGEELDAPALKALIRAAVATNVSRKKAAPPKVRKSPKV